MTEFAYNNAKNVSIGHTSFESNYGYQPCISYKKHIDPHSKSKSANELLSELQDFMLICCEILYYVQKLQKQAHNKGTKPKSYIFGDKICLNSKYIKTK